MRALLHVLATAALLPYVLLAMAFVLLERAMAGGTLPALFEALFVQATWLVPWGILGLMLFFVALVALGVIAKLRWLGGVVLCVVAMLSLAIVIIMPTAPIDAQQLVFLLPCMLVAVHGAWVAMDAVRVRRSARQSIDVRA